MQLKENTAVFTANGEKVGNIQQVILDPKTFEVTHVILQQGVLLTEDKVMPTEMIKLANEEQVVLNEDATGRLEDLPYFEVTDHIPVEERDRLAVPYMPAPNMPAFFWYHSRGNTWPYAQSNYVSRMKQQIPEGTLPLEAGTKVTSAEGEHIGDVEKIVTDPDIDRATHILISQGLIFKDHKLIPTTWINTVSDDEINLAVNMNVLEKVPSAS